MTQIVLCNFIFEARILKDKLYYVGFDNHEHPKITKTVMLIVMPQRRASYPNVSSIYIEGVKTGLKKKQIFSAQFLLNSLWFAYIFKHLLINLKFNLDRIMILSILVMNLKSNFRKNHDFKQLKTNSGTEGFCNKFGRKSILVTNLKSDPDKIMILTVIAVLIDRICL